MSRIIEAGDGVEVYASDSGLVCIKHKPNTGEETIVAVHPEDIPLLKKHLDEAQKEALQIRLAMQKISKA